MPSIDDTLAERGSRYGEFTDHAEVTQSIKVSIASGNNWDTLDDDMKECLEMIAHKIGRIVNGDPNYVDSWTDIIGYTRLVEKRLIDEDEAVKARKAWLAQEAEKMIAAHQAQKVKVEPTDKELADKVRGLAPGVHIIYVNEESGEVD